MWGGTPEQGGADRTQRLLRAQEDGWWPANSRSARLSGSAPLPCQHPKGQAQVLGVRESGVGGASWAGGARAGGGIPAPGAGHPEARADLRRGGRGRLDRKAGARTPAVLTGGRLHPARPSPPCWVPDPAAPRGAGPPPRPRLRRRAGNFSAKVILQARPRPRSGWLGLGWTGTSGLPETPGSPGRVDGFSAGASLLAPTRVSFHGAQPRGGDRSALPSRHPQVNWAALALLSRAAWSAVAMGTAGTQVLLSLPGRGGEDTRSSRSQGAPFSGHEEPEKPDGNRTPPPFLFIFYCSGVGVNHKRGRVYQDVS